MHFSLITVAILLTYLLAGLYINYILQQTFHVILFLLAILNSLKYLFPFNSVYSQNSIHKYVRHFSVAIVLKDVLFFSPLLVHFCFFPISDEVGLILLIVYMVSLFNAFLIYIEPITIARKIKF